MPSRDQWEEVARNFIVGPPHTRRQRGRPKKQRIRSKDEEAALGRKKGKRVHHCTRCKGSGHHRNSCKEPLNVHAPVSEEGGTPTENM